MRKIHEQHLQRTIFLYRTHADQARAMGDERLAGVWDSVIEDAKNGHEIRMAEFERREARREAIVGAFRAANVAAGIYDVLI